MPGRIRTVKPEFFSDEDIAALDPLDRIAFLGLLCYADKAGRLEHRPIRLATMILPYEQGGFEGRLARLVNAGFLVLYENCGRKYLQIRTFTTHQRPHHTEPESKIPSPDAPESSALQPLGNGVTTGETLSKNGVERGTTVVTLGGREGKGMERKGERQPRATPALDGFDEFWSRYPRKIGKGGAEAAWTKLSTADRRAVMEAIPAFSEQWASRSSADIQFCPHPATWLNQRRWKDEVVVDEETLKEQKEKSLQEKWDTFCHIMKMRSANMRSMGSSEEEVVAIEAEMLSDYNAGKSPYV